MHLRGLDGRIDVVMTAEPRPGTPIASRLARDGHM
jgi:hypothetical protein